MSRQAATIAVGPDASYGPNRPSRRGATRRRGQRLRGVWSHHFGVVEVTEVMDGPERRWRVLPSSPAFPRPTRSRGFVARTATGPWKHQNRWRSLPTSTPEMADTSQQAAGSARPSEGPGWRDRDNAAFG